MALVWQQETVLMGAGVTERATAVANNPAPAARTVAIMRRVSTKCGTPLGKTLAECEESEDELRWRDEVEKDWRL